jgi:hypothetical protein
MENISKEVARYIRENVKTKRAYGELGHPTGPQINLERVSHIITELAQDGHNYVGKALIVNTPMGNIARGLLESGAKLGVSTRGMGSIEPGKDGSMIVQKDYKIATGGDIVADPSAPNAFVEGIMEDVSWLYDATDDTWHLEHLAETKKSLKKMNLREIQEKKVVMFEEYLSALASKLIF